MTSTAIERPKTQAAPAKVTGTALSRLGRGLRGLPPVIVAYLIDADGLDDVTAAADGDPTSKAKIVHRQSREERRANATTFLGTSGAWLTGGWTALPTLPAAFIYAALCLSLAGSVAVAWKGKGRNGWLWPARLGVILAASVACEWLHLMAGTPVPVMILTYVATLLTLIWYIAEDGDPGNEIGVTRIDQPKTVNATEGAAVMAIAKGVGVGVQRDGTVDPDAAKAEVTIVGTPGTTGKWTRTHFQLQTKVFADLERSTTPTPMQKVAGSLRRPSGWVFVERTGDESQGLLYVADSNPWPTAPVRWRGLDQLTHDAWQPTVIGVDMLTGQPVAIPTAATSDMCGASPGGGKTAWRRRELCLLAAAGRQVDRVVFDLKGDGALAMFEPVCSHYADGDDEKTMRDLAEWLDWLKRSEAPRRKAALKRLVREGAAPDVKLTREIAANPDYELPLMTIDVDEAQEGCSHKTHGQAISDGLIYAAKQGRSLGIRLRISTQKPTDDRTGIPSALNSVLPTRIAGRAEDYQVSKATLLTSKLRADLMPEGPEGLFYLRLPGGRTEKVLAEYVDANQARDYITRVLEHQRGPSAPVGPPRVLVEMHRLLTDRGGRMLSEEMAAAMAAYGLIEVTDTDRAGHSKTDEQIRQEKLADLVRPFNVRTRPDPNAGNRMAYWLERIHRDHGDVGVAQGLERAEKGRLTPHLATVGDGSPEGSRTGSRRLRVVG